MRTRGTFLNRIVAVITTLNLLLMPAVASAQSTGPSGSSGQAAEKCPAKIKGCRYSQNHPCPTINAQKHDELKQGQMAADANTAGFCQMLKTNDAVCQQTQYMTYAYTAIAATCLSVCIGSIASVGILASLEPVCTYGSAMVGVVDTVWAIKTDMEREQWTFSRAGALKEQYARIGSPALAATANTTTMAVSLMTQAATKKAAEKATEKVAEKATEQVAEQATEKVTEKVAEQATEQVAEEVAEKTAEKVAEKGTEQVAQKGTEEAAKSSGANVASCISAALNSVFAGIRYHHWKSVQEGSAKTYPQVWEVYSGSCHNDRPPTTISLGSQQGMLSSAASAPPVVATAASPTDEFAKDIEEGLASGEVAASFAEADFTKKGLGLQDPKGALNTALKALNDQGITPNMLARSLAESGVTGTLAKMPGVDGGMKEALRRIGEGIDRDAGGMLTTNAMAFDTSGVGKGGGSSSSKPESNNPFAGLMGNRGPAAQKGGAQLVKFGGFKNDIWHTGTQKTIFEIVSDKTQSVSNRVGRIDY